MTYGFAVQPISWGAFDPHGCEWATDMRHAYLHGKIWGEPCMVWMVPASGKAIPWCRCDQNTNAIADLVFGR